MPAFLASDSRTQGKAKKTCDPRSYRKLGKIDRDPLEAHGPVSLEYKMADKKNFVSNKLERPGPTSEVGPQSIHVHLGTYTLTHEHEYTHKYTYYLILP